MPFATTSCRSFKPVGLPCRTIGKVALGCPSAVEYSVHWIGFCLFLLDISKPLDISKVESGFVPGTERPTLARISDLRTASPKNERKHPEGDACFFPYAGKAEVRKSPATVRVAGGTQPHSAESLSISEDLERPRGRRIRPLHSEC
jgi:hypothetical protein